jgi:hypothetical protein
MMSENRAVFVQMCKARVKQEETARFLARGGIARRPTQNVAGAERST